MFICPNCHVNLVRAKTSPGVFWVCPSCGGRSATVALLRRNIKREVVNDLWQTVRKPGLPRKRMCPACYAQMAEVPLLVGSAGEVIDVCTRCQFVWFDASEYASLPQIPHQKTFVESLTPDARERYALLQVEAIRERAAAEQGARGFPVNEGWQAIPALLGLPVEYDAGGICTAPFVTWSLAAFMALFGLLTMFDLEPIIRTWGLVPAEALRCGGLTFLTSFFLHGGLFHLLSNVYFLIVFGDNVEQTIGRWQYALLLMLAALVGDVAHISLDPASTVPCVGASGGISGVIAYYALAFPHAKLGILLRWGFIFKWVTMPASVLFLLWLVLQGVGVGLQSAGLSHVSALAHLGGVSVGVFFWSLGQRKGESFL